MSRNTKTRTRLLYLLGGTLAVSALVGGAFAYRAYHRNKVALQAKSDGLAAVERGDHVAANALLSQYLNLNRYKDDLDVWLAVARARRKMEALGLALNAYQRVLELSVNKPESHLEAQTNLLELYAKVGYNTEALSMADTLLTRTPDDTQSLYIKTQVLRQMHKLNEAETLALRLTTLAPLNLDYHLLVMQLMLDRGKQSEIEAYTNKLAQTHPNDDHFVLLKGYAAAVSGNSKNAITLVKPLAARPLLDPDYTQTLINLLDRLELFADAFTVLEQAAKNKPDLDLSRLWIRRLFETNRLPMLLEQTATLKPADTSTDVEILGMRALALARLEQRPQADALLAALDQRGGKEAAAKRWAAALRPIIKADAAADPMQTIAALRDALIVGTNNTILQEELGNAYAAAGARDKATTLWTLVARQSPAWAAPLVRLSQALIAAGRANDALAAAKAAQLRAPNDHDALMCLAVASVATITDLTSPQVKEALTLIADLEKQFPKDYELLSLKAGVLAQTQQRESAIAVLRSILDANPVAPENVLLSLAGLSESFKLELEEACFETSQKAHGLTAELTYARARWLHNHQHAPEGLAFFEQSRAGHAEDTLWRHAWAAYLDLVDDPRAKAEWTALGNGRPKDVKIQWAVLSARAVQGEHDFMGRTIDRLTQLLGEDSLALRLVRARWYLQGTATEADATQASILLSDISRNAPDMIQPKLLLASSYMRLGNVSGAIDQLIAVSDMQPDHAGIAVELARLLQSRGEYARAKQYLDRAIRSKSASLQNMRQAASLLALQGNYTAALELLEKTYAAAPQQTPDLVLAALYRQLNQPQKTEALCRQLLEKPDATTIAFCADFYASQNRPDDAQKALALLDGLKLTPGTKEIILAEYANRYGTPDQTLKYFQAAAQAAPTELVIWQQLVAFCLGTGKTDEALAAITQASQKIPTAFDTLRKNLTLVKDATRVSGTRQLLMMLTVSTTGTEPVLEALRTLVTAQQQKDPPYKTVTILRKLADQNPRILPLQTITLQYLMDAGMTDEAVQMANRTVQSFPATVEPLRLATNVLGAAQQWSLALNSAKEWKRLGTGETLDADLAIAAAQLRLGDANAAAQQIQPYLEQALLDPDKFSGIILLRAQGLLVSRQPEQAEALFKPLLAKSAQWRGLWLTLAVQGGLEPDRAKAWIEQVTPLITDVNEKSTLAQAWIALGRRTANNAYETTGRNLLQSLTQAADAPLSSLLVTGNLCESAADWTGAETVYRQAIQKFPASYIAYNNLAYVLVQKKGNLQEAQQLITKAIELEPLRAALFDTKAAIQAALKDYKGADASLIEAKRLEPKNLEWNLNRLALLLESGQTPAARVESQYIASALSNPEVTPAQRQRYETLRAKLQ